ncbi:MAG: hypothetical protein ACLQGP_39770 [Isosphaeraceae bacterium]
MERRLAAEHRRIDRTLSTYGHVYATDTDTIGYAEDTGDTATDSASSWTIDGGWAAEGSDYDDDIDTDNDTQTISDTRLSRTNMT